MAFRIAARTILQLGAELISSDAIAFYELIKNAFDAKSPDIKIWVVERIPYPDYKYLKEILTNNTYGTRLQDAKEKILSKINFRAPLAERLQEKIESTRARSELLKVLCSANFIRIQDGGEGMSIKDLEEIYLTIGTRSRYLKRRELQLRYSHDEEMIEDSIRPVLGEKGVGRLSVMRLGNGLRVRTKKTGEHFWNFLEVDWSQFSHESDLFVEDIDIRPWRGKERANSDEAGTTITISDLTARWSKEKLQEIARDEFRKLTDPFTPSTKYPVKLQFNGDDVFAPRFDKILYDLAHAKVAARFEDDQNMDPQLIGEVDYRLRKKKKEFKYGFKELVRLCNLDTPSVLHSLGPFNMMFYWYNRSLIRGIEGLGKQQDLRNLIGEWSGGMMVFRDGFRVLPYGGKDNDWLNLDKKAFGASGYKLNRQQIIGKVDISSIRNPKLIDQTNREGLVDNDEKSVLVELLKVVLFTEFKVFTSAVERDINIQERLSFKTLEQRLEEEEDRIQENILKLASEFGIPKKNVALETIQDTVDQIKDLLDKAKALAELHEDDRTKYLNLAGIGLMAEIIAHELNRASDNLLGQLKRLNKDELPAAVDTQLETFEYQLKTLQKRLKIIDPVSTRGRQVKENFDLAKWCDEVMFSHKNQFQRHGIKFKLAISPKHQSGFVIRAVKGMIVQILENLTANSVYWLKENKKEYKEFKPEISIIIDTDAAQLLFTDNGPGIPLERREEVFLPFYSTKPFKLGRGLGLFISREIAEYNNAKLYLSEETVNEFGNLATFVLDFDTEQGGT